MECKLYKKLENKKVQCTACAHKCKIPSGKTGICGVRKNINGKLKLLVYKKVIAKNIDPIEKKPLFHFLPKTKTYSIGTLGCNFHCDFCQNFEISQVKEVYHGKIFGENIEPKEIVKQAKNSGCKSIAYTYNEPSIYSEFVHDTAKIAHKEGLKNIIVTNGYFTKQSLNYLAKYIDAMNIDLKSFSEEFYKKRCSAKLKPVLETIKQAHKKGIHIEITTLIIPKENESEKELKQIAKFIASIDKNIPWHISRFFPMYKMSDKIPTKISTLKKAKEIGERSGLKHVYIGNV